MAEPGYLKVGRRAGFGEALGTKGAFPRLPRMGVDTPHPYQEEDTEQDPFPVPSNLTAQASHLVAVPESVEFSSPDPFLLHRPMTRRPAPSGRSATRGVSTGVPSRGTPGRAFRARQAQGGQPILRKFGPLPPDRLGFHRSRNAMKSCKLYLTAQLLSTLTGALYEGIPRPINSGLGLRGSVSGPRPWRDERDATFLSPPRPGRTPKPASDPGPAPPESPERGSTAETASPPGPRNSRPSA